MISQSLKKGTLVVIHWVDVVGARRDALDLTKNPEDDLLHLKVVGWVDACTDKAIRILHEEPIDGNGSVEWSTYPWISIEDIRILEE